MNFEEKGLGIMRWYSDEDDKKGKLVYIENDVDDKLAQPFSIIEVQPGQRLSLVPAENRERDVLYITGASGTGKSYFTNQYVKQYKKRFPKRPVYLISSLLEDTTLDGNKSIKRLKLDETFMNEVFTIDMFEKTLVIFDDCDVIKNKDLKKKIFNILDVLLQIGRHKGCSVVFTSHLANNRNETKIILAEATSITYFPKSLAPASQKYLLENYTCMTREQIQAARKLKTRSVTVIKSFPQVLLAEKEAFILGE